MYAQMSMVFAFVYGVILLYLLFLLGGGGDIR